MINLRYHIVSITAVFLALAIGLALGSTLIQRGLVDNLNTRLDELGDRLDRTDGENADLRDEIDLLADRAEQFGVEGRVLFGGHLDEVPVLLLSMQGTDDDLVADARTSLRAAGALVTGTLSFTARWNDLTDDEVAELSALFNRRLSNQEVARNLVLRRLAEELIDASEPAPEPDPPPEDPGVEIDPVTGEPVVPTDPTGPGEPSDTTPGTTVPDDTTPPDDGEVGEGEPDVPVDGAEPDEPAPPATDLIDSLIALGYLEFFPESAGAPLPRFGARYVFVTDDEAVLDSSVVAAPLLEAMAMAPGAAAPIVVASVLIPADESDDEGGEPSGPLVDPVVALVRDDDRLRQRISTIDDLESFAGHSAMVLSVAGLDDGRVGHYGTGPGATSLVPLATT